MAFLCSHKFHAMSLIFFILKNISIDLNFKLLVMHNFYHHFIMVSSGWRRNLLCLRPGLVLTVNSATG